MPVEWILVLVAIGGCSSWFVFRRVCIGDWWRWWGRLPVVLLAALLFASPASGQEVSTGGTLMFTIQSIASPYTSLAYAEGAATWSTFLRFQSPTNATYFTYKRNAGTTSTVFTGSVVVESNGMGRWNVTVDDGNGGVGSGVIPSLAIYPNEVYTTNPWGPTTLAVKIERIAEGPFYGSGGGGGSPTTLPTTAPATLTPKMLADYESDLPGGIEATIYGPDATHAAGSYGVDPDGMGGRFRDLSASWFGSMTDGMDLSSGIGRLGGWREFYYTDGETYTTLSGEMGSLHDWNDHLRSAFRDAPDDLNTIAGLFVNDVLEVDNAWRLTPRELFGVAMPELALPLRDLLLDGVAYLSMEDSGGGGTGTPVMRLFLTRVVAVIRPVLVALLLWYFCLWLLWVWLLTFRIVQPVRAV